MARVNGPLMSMSASGALAGTIVFAHWKGRAYVRQLVKPANPKSGGQTSMRAMMKFLSQQWSTIVGSDQASWEDLADAGVFSPFNAYTKVNLGRNRDFLAPSTHADQLVTGPAEAIDNFTVTAGVRSITVAIDDLDITDLNWGFLLFHSLTTGFTPSFSNLLAVIPRVDAGLAYFVHSPLAPDTYYYDVKPFALDGHIGALKGEQDDIVS